MKKIVLVSCFILSSFINAFAQPANDACAGAQSVTPNGTCVTGTTVAAADNWTGTVGCQSANNHPEVWYTFVSTGTQASFTVTSGTLAGNIELTLVEASGPCTGLLLAGSSCGASPLSATFNGLTVGTTYYYTISSSTGSQGTFTTCVTTSSPPPVSGQDCGTAAILCNNAAFSQGSSTAGSGTVFGNASNENLSALGCLLTDERQSLWYKFTVGCSGTVEFLIDPVTNTDDYDWAIYDITTSGCALTPGGAAAGGATQVACNYSGCPGNTGILDATTDPCTLTDFTSCAGSPTACNAGDVAQFSVAPPTLTAGHIYALVIDNFTLSNNGFAFQWLSGMTAKIGPDAAFTMTTSNCGLTVTPTKTCSTTNSTYLWNFGDGSTSTSASPGSHTYAVGGQYVVSLTVTDALGCSDVYSLTVNAPTANAGTDQTKCAGQTFTLAGTLGGSATGGTWSGGTGTFSPNATTAAAVYTPGAGETSGTVTLTWTPSDISGACPLSADQVVLTINPTPTAPTAGNNGPVCVGSPLSLTANTLTGTYTWTGPNGFSSSTEDPTVSASATAAMAGTYSVTITSAAGCTSAAGTTTVVVNTIPTAPTAGNNGPVCIGSPLSLTANTLTGTYSWTGPNGFTSSSEDPTVSASATAAMAGTYSVTITSGGCTSVAGTTTVTVNTLPATPTASVTVQPTCVSSGTIVVTAPSGANIQYSIGGAYQSSGTFSGLTAGSYNVTAQNTTTGCISNATVLVVNTPPGAPAAPTASVTVQPTCTTPTGTIVVTAPTGGSIQYSVGGAYQASGTFSGLAPGNYNVTAQDMGTGCISALTALTVNAIPSNPAAPTASVTVQPTCTTPTGTIVITAPTGASIQYSIGGAYQASGTFSGLAPGTYSVTAQNTTTGCISSVTSLTVNPIPSNPAAPSASVTVQPTCTTPTGTIVITTPTGASIQYSNGGAYQASGTFSGLAPGSYNITAQDMSTGCISSITALTVNPIPSNPAAPTASVTFQPTCTTPTGTIVITAPTGASIEYSIGGTYQASGTFTGLPSGNYNVTAQDITTGCISSVTTLTVDPITPAPAAPTGSVTVQPTCTTPTGTIVITAPTGVSIEYSIGGSYQASGTFSGIAPGTYNVTAQDVNTGCISSVTSITVDPIPAPPADPTASTTIQPTCVTPGTIVVTAPTGASIQYSIDGIVYQASGTFAGLTAGTYNVTAQDMNTGCISNATAVVVNTPPGAPATPTASASAQPTCLVLTGTIDVTAPTGASIQYSIDGTTYQASGTFSGLAPGTYSVTAQDMNTGCVSAFTSVTINPVPAPPAAPTALVSVQPDCITPTGTIDVTAPTGATIEYSIDGTTYQANSSFTGLAPGTYNVTAQDNTTGCVSSVTTLTVNPVPNAPAAPTASVTVQPTCTTPTGTIVVTAPTGASILYSIGGAYQASGTFTGLAAGTYNVTAQDSNTGCTSAVTTLTINAVPNAPAAPTASVTVQPTCTTTTGTIVATTPTGASIQYSIGGAYQASGTFTGLAPGTYTITAQDVSTGCISSSTTVTVNPIPNPPTVNAGNNTTIPCGTTSFNLSGTTNANSPAYTWTGPGVVSGGNTATPTINTAGTYTLTVVDGTTGCSATSTVTITTSILTAGFTPDITSGVAPLTVNFTNTSVNATSYTWTFGDGNSSTVQDPSNIFLNTGSYTVILVATNGTCSDTATTVIDVFGNSSLEAPNVFTPNNDGNNDVYKFIQTGLKELNATFYDRWGLKIAEITEPDGSWDGRTTAGKVVPDGTYYYILNAKGYDSKEYQLQGYISITR